MPAAPQITSHPQPEYTPEDMLLLNLVAEIFTNFIFEDDEQPGTGTNAG